MDPMRDYRPPDLPALTEGQTKLYARYAIYKY